MKDLNDKFASIKRGDLSFLYDCPLQVDPRYFEWLPGDKQLTSAAGFKQKTRTALEQVMSPTATGQRDVINNKTMTVYADFNVLKDPPHTGKVGPSLHLVNFGAYSAKMFYLPWNADTLQTMVLDESADLFMTATMHGCRFEVKDFGDGRLAVAHANVQPNSNYDAQAKVLQLLKKDTHVAPLALSYGKDTYFPDANRLMHRAKYGLMLQNVRPEHVVSSHVDTYMVNVVGCNQNGKWRFFTQLVASVDVELHEMVKKKRWKGLRKSRTVDSVKSTTFLPVVLKVAEIWPREIVRYEV